MMNVAKRFGDNNKLKLSFNLDIPAKALYLLAAPSTPEEAVDKVLDEADLCYIIWHIFFSFLRAAAPLRNIGY